MTQGVASIVREASRYFSTLLASSHLGLASPIALNGTVVVCGDGTPSARMAFGGGAWWTSELIICINLRLTKPAAAAAAKLLSEGFNFPFKCRRGFVRLPKFSRHNVEHLLSVLRGMRIRLNDTHLAAHY
ncbi:hypothetical protein ZHAS_00020952 [Anopheles sinensis]|uniref:Uncharacterized protein n=1 Tax=Anopheles sinensis TaxID=74873 RepID=A0A084WR07_ANOSI|nr:hypothetical protein ZHAS_00020952 [Anopheles sinensis]